MYIQPNEIGTQKDITKKKRWSDAIIGFQKMTLLK